jgi:hypothetical protein
MGYTKPSKIQERALPLLLMNPPSNLIGQSQSGTGKTAAFVLNMLQRVDLSSTKPQAKLEKERDGSYADLRKIKGKYDTVCQEVENRRKKTESSFDHGKQKAQSAFQQQQGEMHNAKNTYLITINVTNKQKERYYHEYVPELLDVRQRIST